MSKIVVRYDKKAFSKEQNEAINRAFKVAEVAHTGQLRSSGEPYLVHPVTVASIVAEWGLDHEAIMAALLHDVVEDTDITLEQLAVDFGPKVAELVDGVTKLKLRRLPGLAEDSARREASTENLRKLLLATAKDYRVIMVKLADRLHNLRTLEHLSPERRQRIARESLEIFAPLADRLGMGQLKSEMEDLSFRYARPDDYDHVMRLTKASIRKSAQYLALLKHDIRALLGEGGLKHIEVEGRQKHLYSIYKKLVKVDGDIDKIYDLIAIRVIVPDVAACYQALGLIHQQYKPLIYRIKDYIAVPKPNGYQSLHTTVFARDGRITEIQIRTPQMHDEAERGLAAHFFYDSHKASAAYARGESAAKLPAKLGWVQQLANIKQLAGEGQEFLEDARLELFTDRIFVFSPKGDLYDLPEGSTPLDFAFAVHSDMGLRTMGARVNGRMVTLDARLENRDVVEVITRRQALPNRDWLSFVKTPGAKNRIRSWFRAASRDGNVASGRAALETELKAWGKGRLEDLPPRQVADALDALHVKSAEDLLAAIGEGALTAAQAIRRLLPDAARPASLPVVRRVETTGRVIIEGGEPLPYSLAACCRPVFPQPLVGYITRGAGVTVHALGCPNLPGDTERFVGCHWETLADVPERLLCRLEVHGLNRVGLISDITSIIARQRLNITQIVSGWADRPGQSAAAVQASGEVQVSFSVDVPDLFALADLMRRLEHLPGVTSVRRA
ncbi:MAG TPA: bifunctional (p)ppGpp synthetase/guanosine-3',5'-bis(diphosphate) 3'-pyrophosphohydrolase [Candidatus Saccharimonadia bacterium]|nr:bifunctional (p)ppGpp synthetase/guanosine-3',5'-bis(diphosphate) 3'-pyrophosphohydrolase [Candidatus Saccharimonadia bacterium]